MIVWKDIAGYEGLYQVSNSGEIRSYDRVVLARSGKPTHRKGRVLKQIVKKNGYCVVTLTRNKHDRKQMTVHRLVAKTFLGEPVEGLQVNHIDGDKTNNDVSNLEWTTPKENTRHSIRNGLRKTWGNQFYKNMEKRKAVK
ncbi:MULTISPECIES: NUMOD4 motif-containing HNH endonuclease [unclassified Exiguobacterium]|uniref:NUMOD4 motif-containing HNH endonuclease n=1 Tax=unclassified Exiguobacterium TaxID=2644629 RepID=UPI001BEB6F28|nr:MULTISPECIES: NUMOD4 motif-containing HNH endonuclease [unclassified Exiguobacterium]